MEFFCCCINGCIVVDGVIAGPISTITPDVFLTAMDVVFLKGLNRVNIGLSHNPRHEQGKACVELLTAVTANHAGGVFIGDNTVGEQIPVFGLATEQLTFT